ncbi:hypothetical protein [Saccharothrix lopnurensis]|uniref:Uncharacterized protein n=1 Tax=Saccharothrix lopnurensis TaxID=1670621 RepID=A0ABW1P9M5_9PSEU
MLLGPVGEEGCRSDVAELRAAGAVDVLEDLTGIDRVRPALTR